MDKKLHKQVIEEVLSEINSIPYNSVILKGGTALMMCYGLDRFSEDIDLDSTRQDISNTLNNYCNRKKYEIRLAKNTDTVKRFIINYDKDSKLKVEVSYRNKNISDEYTTNINGIKTYKIEYLLAQKNNAFVSRNKIRDLHDLLFIVDTYYDQIPEMFKHTIGNVLAYEGLEKIDYLINQQFDELVDKDKMYDKYFKVLDKLGINFDEEELSLKDRIEKSKSDHDKIIKKENRDNKEIER